jgi:hypothetical protein
VIITVYGDESGTHKGSPFMLLAGYVSTLGKWNAFDAAWRRALTQIDNNLSHFHATDHWGTDIGERFAPHIVKLAKRYLLLGYVIRLNKADYEKYYIAEVRPRKPQLDTMYGVSFRFLVSFLITRLPTLLGRYDITFNIILEAGAQGSKDAERIRAELRKQLPTETAMVGGVTFEDKKKLPGLQVSDALAFGAFQIEPGNPQQVVRIQQKGPLGSPSFCGLLRKREVPNVTFEPLVDIPEDYNISQANRAVLVRPPIFRCELDGATLGALKTDILALVEIRKRYAESLKNG